MLQITGFYASLLALIILWLCYKVVVFRRIKRVEIGDGLPGRFLCEIP